ncbi:DNA primase [candidate division KSB1 bacterium]
MYIPEEKIEEIRELVDIVDFITGYVELKKKGRNYFGLCPFHMEKTPSFSVNLEKQIFHCFGCGEGGNVFSFVMNIEKLTFPEAIEFLADKFRIPIKKEGKKSGVKKENLYSVNERAAQWFHNNLISDKAAKKAREYLERRGIIGNIIDIFTIGYAPDKWDGLLRHFGNDTNTVKLLERSGLVIPRNKKEGHYDRFRNRIMFPIRNEFGKVVGFGGRKLDENEPGGKYVNSPETEIYNKSKILYGLYESKNSIKEKEYAVIVEGNIDLISLHMEGISNVVAPLGTSLTNDQARSLSRFASKVVIIFDADEAGLKATVRAAEILVDHNMDMEIVIMPKGEDPDSYIKKQGLEKFNALLEKRISLIDFLAKLYHKRYKTPIEKTKFLNEILTFFSNITDNIKRGYFINELSTPLEMNPVELQEKTARLIQKRKINYSKQTDNKFDEEEDLLRLFFSSDEARDVILREIELSMIRNSRIKGIFEMLLTRYKSGHIADVAELMDYAETGDIKRYLSEVVFKRLKVSKDIDGKFLEKSAGEIAHKIIMGKRKISIDNEISKIRIRLKKEGDNKEVLQSYMDLLNRSKALDRELKKES